VESYGNCRLPEKSRRPAPAVLVRPPLALRAGWSPVRFPSPGKGNCRPGRGYSPPPCASRGVVAGTFPVPGLRHGTRSPPPCASRGVGAGPGSSPEVRPRVASLLFSRPPLALRAGRSPAAGRRGSILLFHSPEKYAFFCPFFFSKTKSTTRSSVSGRALAHIRPKRPSLFPNGTTPAGASVLAVLPPLV